MDHLRKDQTKSDYASQLYDHYIEELQLFIQQEDNQIEELFKKDFYTQLYLLLEQLPAPRRAIFIMAYIDGMKAKEIAEETAIPQRTVESHLYLGMKFIKSHFKGTEWSLALNLLFL